MFRAQGAAAASLLFSPCSLLSHPPTVSPLNNRNRRKTNETNYKKTHEAVDGISLVFMRSVHAVGYFRMFCPLPFDLSPKIQGDALFWAEAGSRLSTALSFGAMKAQP